MAYEDTKCPCGGKKPSDTMLCDDCELAFADRRELADYQNGELPVSYRRHSAVILVSLAKQRRRELSRA